jgi:hypothetical protein
MKSARLCGLAAIVAVWVLGIAPVALASSSDIVGAALSPAAREVVAMARAGDASGKPFMVVDKRQARVFIFDAAGALLGVAPALLGSAIGDDSAPGVGAMPVARIPLADRTTPAGRFAAAFGENIRGQPVLWVDYDAAIALHSVAITNPREHRSRRLATTSLSDKRMSYGCINVSAEFFDTLVTAQFSKTGGVVYVLPEVRSLAAVFAGLSGHGGDSAAGY